MRSLLTFLAISSLLSLGLLAETVDHHSSGIRPSVSQGLSELERTLEFMRRAFHCPLPPASVLAGPPPSATEPDLRAFEGPEQGGAGRKPSDSSLFRDGVLPHSDDHSKDPSGSTKKKGDKKGGSDGGEPITQDLKGKKSNEDKSDKIVPPKGDDLESKMARLFVEAKCTKCHGPKGPNEVLFDDKGRLLKSKHDLKERIGEFLLKGPKAKNIPKSMKPYLESLKLSDDDKKTIEEWLKKKTGDEEKKDATTNKVHPLKDHRISEFFKNRCNSCHGPGMKRAYFDKEGNPNGNKSNKQIADSLLGKGLAPGGTMATEVITPKFKASLPHEMKEWIKKQRPTSSEGPDTHKKETVSHFFKRNCVSCHGPEADARVNRIFDKDGNIVGRTSKQRLASILKGEKLKKGGKMEKVITKKFMDGYPDSIKKWIKDNHNPHLFAKDYKNAQELFDAGLLDVLEPKKLKDQISNGTAPRIWNVGTEEPNIKGAISIGELGTAEGKKALEEHLKKNPLAAGEKVVIYCGCCAWKDCTKLGMALTELGKRGIKNIVVLKTPTDIWTDWVDIGGQMEAD